MLSAQSEAAFREAKKLDFRAKIRDEIAQREKQEELERQLRKEAAEKRRKEVVEIIRKKKEDEERAIREAEEERQRGIEQLLQKERVSIHIRPPLLLYLYKVFVTYDDKKDKLYQSILKAK